MKGKQGKRMRRQSALELLDAQLKSGVKPLRVDGKTSFTEKVPLTDKDIKRIKSEIENLSKKNNKISVA